MHAAFFPRRLLETKGSSWKSVCSKLQSRNQFCVRSVLNTHVCSVSEFKLVALGTNYERIGLMVLSPLNISCGFFYPSGGKKAMRVNHC